MNSHPAPDLVDRLLAHPLYGTIRDERDLRAFMSVHVVCVWDFQCLLKALQRELTCVRVPWTPTPDPEARRLVNEIVLDEESDVAPGGGHLSHYELYREAMRDAGADGHAIDALMAALGRGEETGRALDACGLPRAAVLFARTTLGFAAAPVHVAAAAFAWGREDVIPDMFRRLVVSLAARDASRWGRLRYYLERHIERDAEVHGVAARALAERLCGADARKRTEAHAAARRALEARLELWDALADALHARATDVPLATVARAAEDASL